MLLYCIHFNKEIIRIDLSKIDIGLLLFIYYFVGKETKIILGLANFYYIVHYYIIHDEIEN